MPLDNRKLSEEMETMLIGMPIDEECWRLSYELPHQTKVMIYDTKCSGCGFSRIEVDKRVFRDLDNAISYAQISGEDLIRTCDYPLDIQIINGKEVYPSLTEIVINTCRFWYKENLEG